MPERRGRVEHFDERRGRGEIVDGDGTRYPFHCTRIADGTRTIPTGARVVFDVGPGPLGQWEAIEIRRA